MTNKLFYFLCIFILSSLLGCSTGTSPISSDSFGRPHDLFPHLKDNGYMIGYSKEAFAIAKRRLVEDDPTTKQALNTVLNKANQYLNGKLYAATDYDRPIRPDKHLYSSINRYAWPDPNGTNSLCDTWTGLPWVHRDGDANPEGAGGTSEHTVDYAKTQMTAALKYLSLAYYFTQEIKYAEKVADQIKAWFLHPDTYMLPNGDWSQCIPGAARGYPSGGGRLWWVDPEGNEYSSNTIYKELENNPNYVTENNLKAGYKGTVGGMIDIMDFIHVVDAALLIIDSGAMSKADYRQLIDWYGAPKGETDYDGMYKEGGMFTWLQEPDNVHENSYDNPKPPINNQAIWLEVDYITFGLFSGSIYPSNLDHLKNNRIGKLKKKISGVFDSDGSQPAEIVRPTSHNYCTYSLNALVTAAVVSQTLGEDSVWGDYGDGKTLKNGIRYMLRYAQEPTSWPFYDTMGSAGRRGRSIKFLATAQYAPGYDDMEGLHDTISTIMKEDPNHEYNLIWPRIID